MADAAPNVYLTYTAKGIREDLADAIWNVDPVDTPLITMIGKTKATQPLHQWQTDHLGGTDPADYTRKEGELFVADAVEPTTLVTNICQILSKRLTVSRTAQKSKMAGRSDELDYQVMKQGKELRLTLERTLFSNQAPSLGDEDTPRQMRTLLGFYSSNVIDGAGATDGTSTAARVDGTQVVLDEDNFNEMVSTGWVNGAQFDAVFVGPANRSIISGFAGPNGTTRQNVALDKSIVMSVELLITDYGDIKVIPSRYVRARDVHFIDSDYLKLAVLDDIHTEERAKVADADSAEIIWEGTLEVRNEQALGLIT